MCVYCDDREREKVWDILAQEGVKTNAWKYERDTMQLWLPGGRLPENWIKARGLSDDEAEQVGENARLTLPIPLEMMMPFLLESFNSPWGWKGVNGKTFDY